MRIAGEYFDAAVVGGGLSGLCAALHLGGVGVKTILLDSGVKADDHALGGFARFSGAKFSLPPAGMGLLPIVGSQDKFVEYIRTVLEILGLNKKFPVTSFDTKVHFREEEIIPGVTTRKYESIVLTPSEIGETIDRLAERVRTVATVKTGRCLGISRMDKGWVVEYVLLEEPTPHSLWSESVFFAGGRTGSELLVAAGCTETNGKGLDVGVRVEFPDKDNLKKLRDLGPDAKILSGACRTFCLNVPGKIHRYNWGAISIPGGVVAEASHHAGNVGILYRHKIKGEALADIIDRVKEEFERHPPSFFSDHGFLADAQTIVGNAYGAQVAYAIETFGELLQDLGLVNWHRPHYIHLPLLDWHWATFAMPGTFGSTARGLYVLGDSSGHARGLLQAALSGYIAAKEYLS